MKPELTEEDFKRIVATKKALIGVEFELFLYGVRGFFPKIGPTAGNDRGIYDDAIFLMDSFGWESWNANTDPSKHRPGIAVLRPGVWFFKKGKHGYSRGNPYPALVQATDFAIVRDGGKLETGQFMINIHKGGNYETGSEGCQTIVKDQWPSFIDSVYRKMEKYDQPMIPYILAERQEAVA